MSLFTIRPATLLGAFGTIAASGGGDGAAVLADDSDSTYIHSTGAGGVSGTVVVGMQALPDFGDGRFTRAALRLRDISAAAGAGHEDMHSDGVSMASGRDVSWYLFTTSVIASADYTHFNLANFEANSRSIWLNIRAGAGTLSTIQVFAMYLDLYYAAKPNVSTPPDYISPITDTNRPTIYWTPDLDSEGGPQTAFEIKIFDQDTFGDFSGVNPDTDDPYYASGEVDGSIVTSWRVITSLKEDVYRIYVRVAQTVAGSLFWSDWSHYSFELDVPNPGVPTISATPDDDGAFVFLNLDPTTGDVPTNQYEIQSKTPTGDWDGLRTDLGGGLLDALLGTTSFVDHDAPNGIEVEYRARAVHIFDSGERSYSGWSDSVTSTWTSGNIWIKHPADPSLSMKVRLASPADEGVKQDARQGVFQALGARLAITISTTRASKTGTIKIRSDNTEEKNDLEAIIDTLSPVLLQLPYQDQEPDRWIAFGSWTRTRMVDNANFPKVWDSIDWTEVEKP